MAETFQRYEPSYIKKEEWISTGTGQILIFHPTMEEMNDFSAYIKKCEDEGAHILSGICKIVPPKEWSPRPISGLDYEEVDDYLINCPVKETINHGQYNNSYVKQNAVYRKKMSVRDFKNLALTKYKNPRPDLPLRELERQFWKNITMGKPIYGADTPGSCYDKNVDQFNITRLGTILDEVPQKILGVTSPFLYFGMYKTSFSWHTEDMDLYSINYLHYGEPKFWYAMSMNEADNFERICAMKFPAEARQCKSYLRHKTFIVSPTELRTKGIEYATAVQYPGEFIITFPRSYHFGFNIGFNCAESTNFALDRWIDFGKTASVCRCISGSVEVDMIPFMKKYRRDEFDSWYNYWYGDRVVAKPMPRAQSTDLPVVKLPSIPDNEVNSFVTEMDSTRDDYTYLWHHQQDFKEEILFNRMQAESYPHCAVCQYFVPQGNNSTENKEIKESSMRYITSDYFLKSPTKKEVNKLELNDSRIFQCKRCSVTVHAECYAVPHSITELDASNDSEFSEDGPALKKKKHERGWMCQRCSFSREEIVCAAIDCALCHIRGGALIPHNVDEGPGEYVHIICALVSRRSRILVHANALSAISLPEDWLFNLQQETPPWQSVGLNKNYLAHDVTLFTAAKSNSVCALCRTEVDKCFVRCQHCFDNEKNVCMVFHPTCAYLCRFWFELRQFPHLITTVCPLHTQSVIDGPDYEDIPLGTLVEYIDPADGNERLEVVAVKPTTYCHVEFLDDSFSSDVLIDDVIACECKSVGCGGKHIHGWMVTVEWEGGNLYTGYFRQSRSGVVYTLKKENGDGLICASNRIRPVKS